MTLSVESVVDDGVGGQDPSTALVASFDPKVARRRAVRAQVVGDHSIGNEAVFLEKLAHQFQRGVLVPLGLEPARLGLHPPHRQRAADRPCGQRFSDKPHPDAKCCKAWRNICANRQRMKLSLVVSGYTIAMTQEEELSSIAR
jgi:hypothetical protein